VRGEHEKELLIPTEGRVASIHSIAEKRNSRKLSFLLGKFSETEENIKAKRLSYNSPPLFWYLAASLLSKEPCLHSYLRPHNLPVVEQRNQDDPSDGVA
jgi:hypothetical protein